jgi:hypothetical protein
MTIDPEVRRTLDHRLATGEISPEQYRQTLQTMAGNGPTSQTGASVQHYHNYTPQPSVAFAVVTAVLWFLIPPIGLLLNLIGLFTGPRRGCFLIMFLVFVILPILVITLLVLTGAPFFQQWMQDLDAWIEQQRAAGGP